MHRVIYEELCQGVVTEPSRAAFRETMGRLVTRGAQAILLRCTEIDLLVDASDATSRCSTRRGCTPTVPSTWRWPDPSRPRGRRSPRPQGAGAGGATASPKAATPVGALAGEPAVSSPPAPIVYCSTLASPVIEPVSA